MGLNCLANNFYIVYIVTTMRYTIGEFAQLLGVTTDTIRYYERQGIITPQKDIHNNYRYFNDLDCRNVLMSRWFRSFDFTLKQASQLTTNASLDDIQASIENQSDHVQKVIDRNKRLLRRLEEVSRDIHDLKEGSTLFTRSQSPGIYRIVQTSQNTLIHQDHIQKTVSQWMELLPFSFYSLKIPSEELNRPEPSMNHNWGLALTESDFEYFGLQLTNDMEYIPPFSCVNMLIETNNEVPLNSHLLVPLKEYLKNQDLSLKGDLIGKMLMSDRRPSGQYHTHIKISVPVDLR